MLAAPAGAASEGAPKAPKIGSFQYGENQYEEKQQYKNHWL
jgi:hypothetical protein